VCSILAGSLQNDPPTPSPECAILARDALQRTRKSMSIEAAINGRYPAKRAVINEVTAASNEIVAAVPGKKIVVMSVMVQALNAQVLTWQTAASALSGAMAFSTSDLIYTHDGSESGLFETVAGEALNLLSGAATQVSGYLTYIEVE